MQKDIEQIKGESRELLQLAERYVANDNIHDSKVILNVLEKLDSRNPKIYYLKGLILEKEKSYQGALLEYKKALRRLPQYQDASTAMKRCQNLISKN